MPAGCQCVVFLETIFKEKCLGWAADRPASRTRRPISDLLPRRQQLLHTLHLTPIPAPSPPPPWCCHRGNVTNCKFTNLLISSHCDRKCIYQCVIDIMIFECSYLIQLLTTVKDSMDLSGSLTVEKITGWLSWWINEKVTTGGLDKAWT